MSGLRRTKKTRAAPRTTEELLTRLAALMMPSNPAAADPATMPAELLADLGLNDAQICALAGFSRKTLQRYDAKGQGPAIRRLSAAKKLRTLRAYRDWIASRTENRAA